MAEEEEEEEEEGGGHVPSEPCSYLKGELCGAGLVSMRLTNGSPLPSTSDLGALNSSVRSKAIIHSLQLVQSSNRSTQCN